MTLAVEVLAELKRLSGDPSRVFLSLEIEALCNVIERRLPEPVPPFLRSVIKLPPGFADGAEPQKSARGKKELP